MLLSTAQQVVARVPIRKGTSGLVAVLFKPNIEVGPGEGFYI
jgi:hypothetical protein